MKGKEGKREQKCGMFASLTLGGLDAPGKLDLDPCNVYTIRNKSELDSGIMSSVQSLARLVKTAAKCCRTVTTSERVIPRSMG